MCEALLVVLFYLAVAGVFYGLGWLMLWSIRR